MFLAVLSGAVIALALVAQADHFGSAFISIAIFMLSVVFFVGLLTVRRLLMLNRDDYMWVVAMNRIRNGYLALHPELEPHFSTSPHDDLAGVLETLGVDAFGASRMGSLFHSLVTLPGMLGVIVASVGGAIGGLIAAGFGAPPVLVLFLGVIFFVIAVAVVALWGRSSVRKPSPTLKPRFPSPGKTPTSTR